MHAKVGVVESKVQESNMEYKFITEVKPFQIDTDVRKCTGCREILEKGKLSIKVTLEGKWSVLYCMKNACAETSSEYRRMFLEQEEASRKACKNLFGGSSSAPSATFTFGK